MLAPLWISPTRMMKMLGNPENFTAEDYAPYKQSGINVFHIAIGTGGPDAYLETLQFLSGYNTFLARHDNWFERVETPARLDGIKASGKVGIMLGVQNSEHFRKVGRRGLFLRARTARLATDLQRPHVDRQRQHGAARRRSLRFRIGDCRAHEQTGHGR